MENTATGITAADRVASSGSLKSLGQGSDTEGAERPVREKLKQTNIGSGQVLSDDDHEMSGASDTSKGVEAAENNENNEEPRGRLKKKRSFELMEGQGAAAEKQGRKRSRGPASTVEPLVTKRKASGEKDATNKNGTIKERSVSPSSSAERTRRGMLSPKGKRNREEFEDEDKPSSDIKDTTETENNKSDKTSGDEPKTKRHRDSNSPEPEKEKTESAKPSDIKIPQGSGFANTSATSPFAALAASKSPTPTASQPQTSESAFKASGFGALATSATSGFGALAASSKPASSPFGSVTATAKPSITGLTSSTPSSFGSLSSKTESKSPFAAATSSGFGSLGGGLGGGLAGGLAGGFGSGGKLTGFGGGSGPKITGLSDKPAKPFGAPKDDKDEEEGSGDDAGGEDKEKVLSPTNEEDPKDERFYEQDVETGEENEETIFVCRAKLYNFVKVTESKKEWKERGLGNLKVNVHKQSSKDDDEKSSKKARFVMRADGSHRVVLNSPIQKELKVGDVHGEKPTSGLILFMGTIDGNELEMLQLKMKQQNAEALWEKVTAIQQEM